MKINMFFSIALICCLSQSSELFCGGLLSKLTQSNNDNKVDGKAELKLIPKDKNNDKAHSSLVLTDLNNNEKSLIALQLEAAKKEKVPRLLFTRGEGFWSSPINETNKNLFSK